MNDFTKILRDQILLNATIFSIFGWIFLDSYYYYFGVRYQFLGLDYGHIVYRGFTLMFFEPVFVLILLSVAIFIYFGSQNWSIRLNGKNISGKLLCSILLAFPFLIGCYLSFRSGIETAVSDMYPQTSSLRQLTRIYGNNSEKVVAITELINEGRPVMLLYRSDREIIIFQEPFVEANRPKVNIHFVNLSSQDILTHREPIKK